MKRLVAVASLALLAGCGSVAGGTPPTSAPSILQTAPSGGANIPGTTPTTAPSAVASGEASIPGIPASVSPLASQPPLTSVHNPDKVTGSLAGKQCHLRGTPPNVLPDPNCTPGGYDPAITQSTIATTLCVPNPGGRGSTQYVLSQAWKDARPPVNQTNKAKKEEAVAYGLPSATTGEGDHLVARQIGGNNDLSNLWLEPGPIPNPKDAVENRLHDWMCAAPTAAERFGRLRAAQQAIAFDWLTAEEALNIK
jgi:hypothetical protein